MRNMSFSYYDYFYMKKAPEFHIPEDDPNYFSEDGILFNKDKTVLLRFPTEGPIRHYKLPDSVEEIGQFAFGKCLLESLDLNRLKRAGKRAVWNCENLRELNFGTEIQVLTEGIVFGCHNLRELTIPPNVRELEDCSVEMCTNLQDVVIPKTVKKLGSAPFGCSGSVIMHFEYNGAVIFVREQALKSGKNGKLVDFEDYDSAFQRLQFETRPLTAFLRLAYPADLTEEWRKFYTSFLRRHIRELTDEFFAKNRVDWMRILIERGVIYEDNIDMMIVDSTNAGTTAITALLLDYKRKSVSKEDEFEL